MPIPLKNESANVNFADGISMFTQITTMGGDFIGGDLGSYTPYPVYNSKMKMVLSDCAHLNSGKLGNNYTLLDARTVGSAAYKHVCTSGPTTWYGRAGLRISFWNRTSPPPGPENCVLGNYGFKLIWSGDGNDAINYLGAKPSMAVRPGDIVTLHPGHSMHAVMWTGYDWRSDCIQRECWCYGRSGLTRYGKKTVLLWRHPGFQ